MFVQNIYYFNIKLNFQWRHPMKFYHYVKNHSELILVW